MELKALRLVQSDGIHPVFTLSSLKKAPGLEAHGAPIISSSDSENTSRVLHALYCANKPLREIELANESGVHPTTLRPILLELKAQRIVQSAGAHPVFTAADM